jgi:hypothetical protein
MRPEFIRIGHERVRGIATAARGFTGVLPEESTEWVLTLIDLPEESTGIFISSPRRHITSKSLAEQNP